MKNVTKVLGVFTLAFVLAACHPPPRPPKPPTPPHHPRAMKDYKKLDPSKTDLYDQNKKTIDQIG